MSLNEIPAPRQHASTGPTKPQLPEPSHAERVRTLVSLASVATLSTLSRKHPGFPFGSLMPFALDPAGRPIFLISNMAMHTQNLKTDPRCSLFIGQALADGDPLGASRATMIGHAEPVGEHETAPAREIYLGRHENSRYWADFSDFGFFRLHPIDLNYVGGFGVMGWVAAKHYEDAARGSRARNPGSHERRPRRFDGAAGPFASAHRSGRGDDDCRRPFGLQSSVENGRWDEKYPNQFSSGGV